MDWPCPHCDQPDSSLLRVVLIGEIVRADDTTLNVLAEVCESLGLLQLDGEGDPPETSEPAPRSRRRLRRVK